MLTLRTPEDVKALAATAEFRLGAELSVALTVTAGSRPLELEAALHTYLAVGDVREIAIHGLEGADSSTTPAAWPPMCWPTGRCG